MTSIFQQELRQTLLELQLCETVAAAEIGRSSRAAEEDIGGNRPLGGPDRREDRHRDLSQKPGEERILRSAEHYRHRLAKARSDKSLELILTEMRATLSAWKRMPKPTKANEPEYGSAQWKRYIAESEEPVKRLAERFRVTPGYISQVRKRYAPAEPNAVVI